jgi:hypothetical protein
MQSIIDEALAIRKAHIAVGMPMNVRRGFKEVNVAYSMSFAFQKAGYYAFPEFPHKGGSIDAIFVRDDEVVVCEWKHLYRRSAPLVVVQTERMLSFKPERDFLLHGFKPRKWKTRFLWVADSWEKRAVDWWLGKPTPIKDVRPFGRRWIVGSEAFPSFGAEWYPYVWVWAFT